MLGEIDHVTIAGSDLDALSAAFEQVGFSPEYGGVHSNGATQMAVISFRDGSYIELISTLPDVDSSPLWDSYIRQDAGPCAWAVQVNGIETAVSTLRERGVAVDGPTHYTRERPDGTVAEWDLAFLGEGEPGTTFPFLIADRTPREHRVSSPTDLADSPLTGVARIVIAVTDLDAVTASFADAFDLSDPIRGTSESLAADLSWFSAAPVVFAEPRNDGRLTDRLATFGPCPCAILLGATDLEAVADAFPVAESRESFADATVRWFVGTETLPTQTLGVYATEAGRSE